jgi:hypothetical protein
MAKRSGDQDPTPEKAKIRVFFAEVEGSNDSVREALKTMVAAMNRPPQMLHAPKTHGNSATPPALQEQADPQPESEEAANAENDSAEVTDAGAAVVRKQRGTGKRDYNAGIELVPDLNFMPEGQQTLRDFYAEKAPRNDMENFLVVIYYMQHVMHLEKIGPGHVRTAMRDVNVPVPLDIKQTLRNMKAKKIWINFSDIEDIRTTTQGQNYIEHDINSENGD